MNNILGCEEKQFAKKLLPQKILCIITVLLAVVINVILSLTATNDTRILFLILNICVDIFTLLFLVSYINIVAYRDAKRYDLFIQSKNDNTVIEACKIRSISSKCTTIDGLDCFMVRVEHNGIENFYYATPELALAKNDIVTLTIGPDNIIMNVDNNNQVNNGTKKIVIKNSIKNNYLLYLAAIVIPIVLWTIQLFF